MRIDPRILFLLALIAGGIYAGKKVIGMARGIRNNNPGNLKLSSVAWAGQVPATSQTDPTFVQFIAPEYGIRAMARVLDTYAARGISTLENIVRAYAPASENDVGAYVASLTSQTGIPSSRPITRADYPSVIAAMIRQENGTQPYESALIIRGIQMA